MELEIQFLKQVTKAAVTYIGASDEYCLKAIKQTWWTCLTKSEWASWLQAFFSVAAIFGSYWLGQRAFKKELENAKLNSLFAADYLANHVSVLLRSGSDIKEMDDVININAGLEMLKGGGVYIRQDVLPYQAIVSVGGLLSIIAQANASLNKTEKSSRLNSGELRKEFLFWHERAEYHVHVISEELNKVYFSRATRWLHRFGLPVKNPRK